MKWPWKKWKKCPWKAKYVRENFLELWFFENASRAKEKNRISSSKTENHIPVKKYEKVSWKPSIEAVKKCAWKKKNRKKKPVKEQKSVCENKKVCVKWKKCAWNDFLTRQKNPKKGKKRLSRTLLVFTGQKKHWAEKPFKTTYHNILLSIPIYRQQVFKTRFLARCQQRWCQFQMCSTPWYELCAETSG